MFWQEDEDQTQKPDVEGMVDVVFAIKCRTLPVDHAWALAEAINGLLPWLREESGAGIHSIHVAESGNGWQRPGDILHPSRRTRLQVRVPEQRVEQTLSLCGQTLDILGHALVIDKHVDTRPLSTLTTLFTRYLVGEEEGNEHDFLNQVADQLLEMGIKPRKMMCGREQVLTAGAQTLNTRSLMIADLEMEESVKLQKTGLGSHRFMGCGLFIPHKSIKEVSR